MARLSFILTIIAVVLVCIFAEQEFYSDRYDDINIEGILTNEKLRLQYYNCFMDNAPCKTADAKFFKGVIGEAMRTQCKKCTEKQKALLDYMADWYTKNRPNDWNAFVKKNIENSLKQSH